MRSTLAVRPFLVRWSPVAIVLLLICVVIAIAHSTSFFLWRLSATPLMEQDPLWRDRIMRVGPADAYLEFQRAETEVNTTMQHQYAHVFGTALYEAEGARGATVCDMQYQFGCLHAFFGHLIAEEGVSGLTTIAEECKRQTGTLHPCEHAMGHGFLSYYGYTDAGMKRALELCQENFATDPVNGCMGGVFMEYNLYTSIGLTTDVRDAQKDGWYSPCDELSEDIQQSCYWWLPQWWHEYLRLSVSPEPSAEEKFSRMGSLCAQAPREADRQACFAKIGQLTVWDTKFDVPSSLALCTRATSDPGYGLICRSYLAYIQNYFTPDLSKALSACEGLVGSEARFCAAYARHEAYIPHDLPLPDAP